MANFPLFCLSSMAIIVIFFGFWFFIQVFDCCCCCGGGYYCCCCCCSYCCRYCWYCYCYCCCFFNLLGLLGLLGLFGLFGILGLFGFFQSFFHPSKSQYPIFFFFISFLPFLFTTHFSIRRLSSNTMLPHLNESRLKGSYYTSTSLASSTRSNINQNADNALRILNDSDKLMADPKQTATALLAVKYGIFESADTNLSYNLMALSKLLSDHPSAWNVVDQSLIDKVSSLSLLQFCFLTNVTNTHYLR